MNSGLHHWAERIVNQAMSRRQRQTVKLCRNQQQLVVPAASFGAFVPDVATGIIEDLDGFRR